MNEFVSKSSVLIFDRLAKLSGSEPVNKVYSTAKYSRDGGSSDRIPENRFPASEHVLSEDNLNKAGTEPEMELVLMSRILSALRALIDSGIWPCIPTDGSRN